MERAEFFNSQEWFLHWDNEPVYSMKLVQEYFKMREF
jgi:hypothetical protein